MNSSLLLQRCLANLVRLILMISEMGFRWLYCCCFVGYCFQYLFNMASSILMKLPSSFFTVHLLSVLMVHPYSSINMNPDWKKNAFLFYRMGLTDNVSIAVHAFGSYVLISFTGDKTLLLRWVYFSTSFRDALFSVEMSPHWLNHIFCLCSHRGPCLQHLVPDYTAEIWSRLMHLPDVICHSVVHIRKYLCGVSSTFSLCKSKDIMHKLWRN